MYVSVCGGVLDYIYTAPLIQPYRLYMAISYRIVFTRNLVRLVENFDPFTVHNFLPVEPY